MLVLQVSCFNYCIMVVIISILLNNNKVVNGYGEEPTWLKWITSLYKILPILVTGTRAFGMYLKLVYIYVKMGYPKQKAFFFFFFSFK